MVDFFQGLTFFILPLGFGSKRIEFFEKQILKFGGVLSNKNSAVSHVLIEDTVSEAKSSCLAALKNYKMEFKKSIKYVKVIWLSKCISQKCLLNTKPFEIEWMQNEGDDKERYLEEDRKKNSEGKRKVGEEMMDETEEGKSSPEKKQKTHVTDFLCATASTSSQRENIRTNKTIIEELEKLANAYSVRNDTWRSHSYKKAINAIILYGKEIKTFQEASSIPGIGEKMALKIMEVIEFGKIQKVESIVDEKTKVLEVFCKIWGVGPSTAEGWYIQGLRNLNDLRERAKLTKQQQIGLKLYDDLLKKIPRNEVVQIYEIVKEFIRKIRSSLSVELVGSFRRGKTYCGDVDLMVINRGVKSPGEILTQLTHALKTEGYLTDDLIQLEPTEDENHHKKYFGIFKMQGENQTHRRLDIFVVPESEYAPALVHYTGSALFNRTIKLVAAKKSMTLTEHGLYAGTVRKGSEVISKGQLIPTPTEEDIFRELGLPYRLPEERDH